MKKIVRGLINLIKTVRKVRRIESSSPTNKRIRLSLFESKTFPISLERMLHLRRGVWDQMSDKSDRLHEPHFHNFCGIMCHMFLLLFLFVVVRIVA